MTELVWMKSAEFDLADLTEISLDAAIQKLQELRMEHSGSALLRFQDCEGSWCDVMRSRPQTPEELQAALAQAAQEQSRKAEDEAAAIAFERRQVEAFTQGA